MISGASMTESSPRSQRVDHLDGLRGVAACTVLFGHLVMMVWPATLAAELHPAGTPGWQLALAASPWSALWDGRLAVSVFFVLSGYVLTAAGAAHPLSFVALAGKRYARLLLPILAATLPALLLHPRGLYFNHDLGYVTGSAWLNSQTIIGFHPGLLSWLYNALWVVFFVDGHTSFNALLWTMRFEWYGSLLVFLICSLCQDWRKRLWGVMVLAFLLANLATYAWLHLFCVGMILHDLTQIQRQHRKRALLAGPAANLLGLGLCAIGLYLPRLVMVLIEGEGQGFAALLWLRRVLPGWQGDRWMLAAVLVVAGVLLSSSLRRWLGSAGCRFLGRISFPLYLFHLPLILSLGSWLMLRLLPWLGMTGAAFATFALVAPLALLVAWIMTWLVERPSLHLAARVGAAAERLWLQFRAVSGRFVAPKVS